MKCVSYSLGLALSNKYLEMAMPCLEPKIFNEKVEVFFGIFLFYRLKPQLSRLNIFGSRHCMTISKYLFDRANSRL